MQLTLQQMSATDEAKSLICELCRNFYQLGWVGGTGGGMSVKTGDFIVMAPSGVQKERMIPDDMFVLDQQGNVLVNPIPRPSPYKPPKLSECSPLFMAVSHVAGDWLLQLLLPGITTSNHKHANLCRHLNLGVQVLSCTVTPSML